MVSGDSFGGLLDLRCDGAVVLLKVLGVLQDAVEVFLSTEEYTNTSLLLKQDSDLSLSSFLPLLKINNFFDGVFLKQSTDHNKKQNSFISI